MAIPPNFNFLRQAVAAMPGEESYLSSHWSILILSYALDLEAVPGAFYRFAQSEPVRSALLEFNRDYFNRLLRSKGKDPKNVQEGDYKGLGSRRDDDGGNWNRPRIDVVCRAATRAIENRDAAYRTPVDKTRWSRKEHFVRFVYRVVRGLGGRGGQWEGFGGVAARGLVGDELALCVLLVFHLLDRLVRNQINIAHFDHGDEGHGGVEDEGDGENGGGGAGRRGGRGRGGGGGNRRAVPRHDGAEDEDEDDDDDDQGFPEGRRQGNGPRREGRAGDGNGNRNNGGRAVDSPFNDGKQAAPKDEDSENKDNLAASDGNINGSWNLDAIRNDGTATPSSSQPAYSQTPRHTPGPVRRIKPEPSGDKGRHPYGNVRKSGSAVASSAAGSSSVARRHMQGSGRAVIKSENGRGGRASGAALSGQHGPGGARVMVKKEPRH